MDILHEKNKMVIYPAIDLLNGQCVRLRQGDYHQVTVYDEDPLHMAGVFRDAGAEWLHVVDLEAARTGKPAHDGLIAEIRRQTGLKIQTGGGIRNMAHLMLLLDTCGIERAVLGTAAVRDRAFTEAALRMAPERIAIGLDARDGRIAVDGWTRDSGLDVQEFALLMQQLGAQTVIYTDISRDGMLQGPALDGIRRLVNLAGLSVVASGGIGSQQDIEDVRATGAAGVIVGKAIYEKKVVLEACWPKG